MKFALTALIPALVLLVGCDDKGDEDTGGLVDTDATTDNGSLPGDAGTDDTGTPGTDDTGTSGTDDTGTGPVDADEDGYTADEDCNDSDPSINPGAEEVCDDVDNNCDDVIDDDAVDAPMWYGDSDEDGYGADGAGIASCDQPEGFVSEGGDCDDTDAAYNPGAAEDDCTDPNDYNCDGSVGYEDADGDGWAACEDCDDSPPGGAAINPGAEEICDGRDNNCDEVIDDDAVDRSTWYADTDEDGFGDAANTALSCEAPAGYTADDSDCDDGEPTTFPGADELCDEVNNDCDLTIDEDAVDASTWYEDDDEDGYGVDSPFTNAEACTQPAGCLLYTSPSPRDLSTSRMPSSA